MSAITVSLPPDGAVMTLRGDGVVTMGAPFAWSPTVQAREVKFQGGVTVIMLDTPDNVTVVTQALDGVAASISPTPGYQPLARRSS